MLHVRLSRCARVSAICFCLGMGLLASGSVQAEGSSLFSPRKSQPEDKLKILSKGSSSKESQQQGMAELPLAQLAPKQREAVGSILQTVSLFRELPVWAFPVEPEVHQYFLDHPEMAVGIWRAMKISKFEMQIKQPGVFLATDNNGTQGQIEILHRDKHQVLALCNGVVHSPILPGDIQAQTLLHLQTEFVKSQDDTIWVKNRLRMYVAFPSQTVEAAAKMVSPLGNMIIDRNLKEVSLFVAMMSSAMAHQPGWVEHITKKLDGVSREQREELIQLTARVFLAERKRELAKRMNEKDITYEDIVRPLSKPLSWEK